MSSSNFTFRCDHFHLRSRDAVEAAGFYVGVLGAREIRRDGSPIVSRVTLDIGGVTLFVEQAPAGTELASTPPHLGIEHIGLAVNDIEAAISELRSQGVVLLSDITSPRPGLRMAFIEGPDAVQIEILQRT